MKKKGTIYLSRFPNLISSLEQLNAEMVDADPGTNTMLKFNPEDLIALCDANHVAVEYERKFGRKPLAVLRKGFCYLFRNKQSNDPDLVVYKE